MTLDSKYQGKYEHYFDQGVAQFSRQWVKAFFTRGTTVKDPRGYTLADYIAGTDICWVNYKWSEVFNGQQNESRYKLTFCFEGNFQAVIEDLKPAQVPVAMHSVSIARSLGLSMPGGREGFDEPSDLEIANYQLEDAQAALKKAVDDKKLVEMRLSEAQAALDQAEKRVLHLDKRVTEVVVASSQHLRAYKAWENAGSDLLRSRQALDDVLTRPAGK